MENIAVAKPRENRIFVFNFKVSWNEISQEELIEWLREHTKKWLFQQHRNPETNDLYWTGRFSSKVKARSNSVKASFNKKSAIIIPNVSGSLGISFYTLDIANRVGGPWKDTDVNSKSFEDIFNQKLKWYPWQSSVLYKINNQIISKAVNVVVSDKRSIGRTFLSIYCNKYNIARRIVPSPKVSDMIKDVSNFKPCKVYIFDINVDLPEARLLKFFDAIANIKDGYIYNKLNDAITTLYNIPEVWVFTNSFQTSKLSSLTHNYIVYTISDSNTLELLSSPIK